jgi:hypothetical protein
MVSIFERLQPYIAYIFQDEGECTTGPVYLYTMVPMYYYSMLNDTVRWRVASGEI